MHLIIRYCAFHLSMISFMHISWHINNWFQMMFIYKVVMERKVLLILQQNQSKNISWTWLNHKGKTIKQNKKRINDEIFNRIYNQVKKLYEIWKFQQYRQHKWDLTSREIRNRNAFINRSIFSLMIFHSRHYIPNSSLWIINKEIILNGFLTIETPETSYMGFSLEAAGGENKNKNKKCAFIWCVHVFLPI